jgi:hypothetical protein
VERFIDWKEVISKVFGEVILDTIYSDRRKSLELISYRFVEKPQGCKKPCGYKGGESEFIASKSKKLNDFPPRYSDG